MNAISFMVLAVAVGVDYGWQQTDDGQWEYILQVEPALLNSLAEGEHIVSELPPELKGVRRIVLRVGTQEVPRGRIPEVMQASGKQTVRRANDRWGTEGAVPLANEELPERPRLDWVTFTDPPRAAGNRWTNELNPPANRARDSQVLSVPSRMFNLPTKNPASEITHFPNDERDDNAHGASSQRDRRVGALPGPAAEDAEIPADRDLIDSRRQSYDEDSRFADSRRATGTHLADRTKKPTASISAGAQGDTPGKSAPLSRSGFPTILALFLFASIGGNLYLGWLARDFYWRYRDLAWEMRSSNTNT